MKALAPAPRLTDLPEPLLGGLWTEERDVTCSWGRGDEAPVGSHKPAAYLTRCPARGATLQPRALGKATAGPSHGECERGTWGPDVGEPVRGTWTSAGWFSSPRHPKTRVHPPSRAQCERGSGPRLGPRKRLTPTLLVGSATRGPHSPAPGVRPRGVRPGSGAHAALCRASAKASGRSDSAQPPRPCPRSHVCGWDHRPQ